MSDPIPPEWAYEIGQNIINADTDQYFAGLTQATEDVMKYRDFETNMLNLKSFESVLGMDIVESSYDFHKPLPPEGIESTLAYCKNDVLATERAYDFLYDKGAVTAVETLRQFVADKLGVISDSLVKSSTNSLMIKLFKDPHYDRQAFFDYMERCDFSYAMSDPNFKAWYDKIIGWADDRMKLEEPELEFTRNNVEYRFAKGGCHGHNRKLIWKNVTDKDVALM